MGSIVGSEEIALQIKALVLLVLVVPVAVSLLFSLL